ncbi:hypothetical protein C8R47DRAFT_1084988 [Mycena vitilis]|nr:hypothetical protein C8R47DRAFT_1084988 [Mycena vitilis]
MGIKFIYEGGLTKRAVISSLEIREIHGGNIPRISGQIAATAPDADDRWDGFPALAGTQGKYTVDRSVRDKSPSGSGTYDTPNGLSVEDPHPTRDRIEGPQKDLSINMPSALREAPLLEQHEAELSQLHVTTNGCTPQKFGCDITSTRLCFPRVERKFDRTTKEQGQNSTRFNDPYLPRGQRFFGITLFNSTLPCALNPLDFRPPLAGDVRPRMSPLSPRLLSFCSIVWPDLPTTEYAALQFRA